MPEIRVDEDEHGGNGDGLFRRNLALLQEPLQRRILQAEAEEANGRIEVLRTASGLPVARYGSVDTSAMINGADPLGQAKEWCDQIPLEQVGALFVYGCGFGYPLFEIATRKHPETLVFVFEPDIRLFAAMLREFHLEPCLRSRKFAFFVGRYEEFAPEFERLMSSDIFHGCTAPTLAFAPGSRLMKRECFRVHERVFEFFMLQLEKMGNDHYDSVLGFHQIVDNVDEVLENPYLSCLKDRFANVPAFIIANGPSLDRAIPALKEACGKALIVASESAVTPLLRNGIVPDAVCVSERSERSYRRHFEGKAYPGELALLGMAVIDPRIFSSFKGPKIPVFRSLESNGSFFNQIVGDGSALFGGKSSAHFAFEAALYMGADPIALVGQDLAYGRDGSTHSAQSVYAEAAHREAVQRLREQPTVHLPSNDGRMIPSNAIWYQFKLIFEQMIAEHPRATVINTTETGAAIGGTAVAKLSAVVRAYCGEPLRVKPHEIINEAKRSLDRDDRTRKRERLAIELAKYRDVYRSLEQRMAKRKSGCERLAEEARAGTDALVPGFRREYERNRKEIMQFLSPDMHILYFQQVIMAGYYKLNALGPPSSPNAFRKAFLVQYETFEHLRFVCESLVRNIGIALGKLADGDGRK
ncbi:motility associated factor glycosyltransferase family protein [Cohnella massiliensis]|uniref:motility associated factor glycosyltransferase family protein n=1 Tax=Cohnella massiliensis TaxID=1816691 RepID=UPI0009BAA242|nr:6-hydroxymethylpterin diphosphokinase MptE-like protein [Cohnella massiliensis]